ncbi:shikimate dehydrogenase [Candidatus Palauibacter sp.]|uniref:shikimate dehydrogenase n=1 Tax=Candidatus Palauibacter sp. TaxID=3101350 RepID=UPI003B02D3EF
MRPRYALLGDPVDHSISPDMHRAAFRTWGLDAEYVARTVTADEVGQAMRGAGLAGGNVTLPHKLVAAETVARASRAVQATGACNCWWRAEDGELAGDNTDVGGLGLALNRLGFKAENARVLVLGAGGAARAAVHTLLEARASRVEILNRTPARARALRDATGGRGLYVVEAPDPGMPYDLVLNATSLGLSTADPLPLELDRGRFRLACDLVYAAGETQWVRHARSLGIRAGDGLEMLVGQAALSLRRWFPGRTPPVDAMRAAAVEALDRREGGAGQGAAADR